MRHISGKLPASWHIVHYQLVTDRALSRSRGAAQCVVFDLHVATFFREQGSPFSADGLQRLQLFRQHRRSSSAGTGPPVSAKPMRRLRATGQWSNLEEEGDGSHSLRSQPDYGITTGSVAGLPVLMQVG
jgi:hypothetical protein